MKKNESKDVSNRFDLPIRLYSSTLKAPIKRRRSRNGLRKKFTSGPSIILPRKRTLLFQKSKPNGRCLLTLMNASRKNCEMKFYKRFQRTTFILITKSNEKQNSSA